MRGRPPGGGPGGGGDAQHRTDQEGNHNQRRPPGAELAHDGRDRATHGAMVRREGRPTKGTAPP